MVASRSVEIAIVGGGPAGTALAARLAAMGREVVVFERLDRPRWRASGVYSSPLTRWRLARLGLTDDELSAIIRPISAMVVEAADGRAAARLEYEPPHHACGFDRLGLEEALLHHARRAGAALEQAATVRQVRLGEGSAGLLVSTANGPGWWRARLVVGADGPSSIVARAAGAAVSVRRFRRAALTGHRRDQDAPADGAAPMEARMVVGDGWYLGIAPVPGARANLGYVLRESALRTQLAAGARLPEMIDAALAQVAGRERRWLDASATDDVQAHLPLAHRVRRAAGPGYLLVGDAAGFLDPLSGEGLHRALVSSQLAAEVVGRWCIGDRLALNDYDRRLRDRFRSKDVVSWLLQLFLLQPRLTRYALDRLARREDLRATFARALADQAPASSLVDPRFHLRLLAP
jgi:menaquinone-9 beta-reductase